MFSGLRSPSVIPLACMILKASSKLSVIPLTSLPLISPGDLVAQVAKFDVLHRKVHLLIVFKSTKEFDDCIFLKRR